jgi:S1-C subfamily serine protease
MKAHALKVLLAFVVISAWPETSSARPRNVVDDAMPAIVMVIAAKPEAGRVIPVSSGSGTIVASNGSVLTNHHVLYSAESEALHPLYLIARYRGPKLHPEIVCAGKPSDGTLRRDVDLAVIRCNMDLDGKPYTPEHWPTIPIRSPGKEETSQGQQIWILGYPNVGAASQRAIPGLVSGWTGEYGGTGSRAFMRTDAAISHGNSGGAAIDEEGNLVGIPTAFREKRSKRDGATVSAGRVGLIRPVSKARDLIAKAQSTEPGAKLGVMVNTRVVESASRLPVEGALVIVLQPGEKAETLSRRDLASKALAWGRSDAAGALRLDRPLARGRAYPLVVLARGYLPLTQSDALTIPQHAPASIRAPDHISLRRER